MSSWLKRAVEKWGDKGKLMLPDLLHVPRLPFAFGFAARVMVSSISPNALSPANKATQKAPIWGICYPDPFCPGFEKCVNTAIKGSAPINVGAGRSGHCLLRDAGDTFDRVEEVGCRSNCSNCNRVAYIAPGPAASQPARL